VLGVHSQDKHDDIFDFRFSIGNRQSAIANLRFRFWCGFAAAGVILAYAGIAGFDKTEPESAGGGEQAKELLLYCGAGIRPPGGVQTNQMLEQ